MTSLSEAEQKNYDWLTSVIQEGSGYTIRFKYYTQKNREKFERKMRK